VYGSALLFVVSAVGIPVTQFFVQQVKLVGKGIPVRNKSVKNYSIRDSGMRFTELFYQFSVRDFH
jgi:hypothetical protein